MTQIIIPLILLLLSSSLHALTIIGGSKGDNNATREVFGNIVRQDGVEVYARFVGTATAEDFYDVHAPFPGRIEDVRGELFQWVDTTTELASLASAELAAVIDSAPNKTKNQSGKKWKQVFDFHKIRAEYPGLIMNVYMSPKSEVGTNDRLFTVARRITIIGRAYEPANATFPKDAIHKGLIVKLTARDNKFSTVDAVVKWILPNKDGSRRAGLEIISRQEGIQPGSLFEGDILLESKNDVVLVPGKSIIKKDGKEYMILEVKTNNSYGVETELTSGSQPGWEFLRPSSLSPLPPNGEIKK